MTMIKSFKLEIDQAHNGQEAVELVQLRYEKCTRCRWYSLIIMDIDMPILNGFEASAEIAKFYSQKEGEKRKPAIIIHSAFKQEKDQARMEKLGLKHFLPKPINQKVLKQLIDKYVSQGKP